MLKPRTAARSTCSPVLWRAVFVTASLSLMNPALGEVEDELDPLVVSALRMPAEASRITSSVTLLDPRELEGRGVISLRDSLNEAPGVIATSTSAQTGGIGSVFIRGTTTPYSQLVVDGIRLSDATAPLGNFFAGASLQDLGRIEVLRGPQAALHGGDSVGGVIWLETARGEGDSQGHLRLEAGSFNGFDGELSHGGKQGEISWFAAFGHGATQNDANQQDYDQSRTALRLEWEQSEALTLGMTFRAIDSRFDYSFFGPNVDRLDGALMTVYADARFTEHWSGRFTAGHYRENYDNDSTFGNFGTDLDRSVVNTDHVIMLDACHRLLFGGYFESTDFSNTIGTDESRDRFGGYVGWQWQPVDAFTADAVVRWEDDESFGDEVTWRLGAAWQALETTRFRAGVGRAFRTPTFLDLYGTAFGPGNPALDAETSLGWDLGIEQRLGERHLISLTWFENQIEDRILTTPLPPVNVPGKTPTRGLETALQGRWCEGRWSYRLAWTYLEASLQDQPDHTATASIDWRPDDRWLLGVGATFVDDRSYGGLPLEDYLLLRVYGSFRVNDHLTVHGRVENLADESYQLSNFGGSVVEGAGLGAFAGITVSF